MDISDNPKLQSPLYHEEELLGAHFFLDGVMEIAQSYPGAEINLNTIYDEAFLIDVSSLNIMTISGSRASLFLKTLSTADIDALTPNQISPALFLNSESQIIDICYVLKNDANSFMLIGAQENSQELFEWLQAYIKLEKDGLLAFEGVDLSVLTGEISALAIGGSQSRSIVIDYTGSQTLPDTKKFKSLLFDKIPVITINISDLFKTESYLLLLQNSQVVNLFRSFMSFQDISVLGISDGNELISRAHPELLQIYAADYQTAHDSSYKNYMRKTKDFIGGNLTH